jgi:DNA-binding MarR family transcriptional regulator
MVLATKAALGKKNGDRFDELPHSKLSVRLWLRLLSCSTIIEKNIRSYLESEFEATLPRFDVLAALDRYPEGLKMGELSSHLYMSNGNVTGLVSRLAGDGLVTRITSEKDRRAQHVKLTPRGKRLFSRMAKEHEAFIESLLGGLSDAKMKRLIAGLNEVHSMVQKRL